MTYRTLSSAILTASLFLWATATQAQDTQSIVNAERAASSWLTLVDQADYAASWKAAGPLFQNAMTLPAWADSATQARAPLGNVRSRTLQSADYSHTLDNAPAGDYVTIQYRTDFDNRPGAIETVTPAKGADGTWHVVGYFIK